MPKDHSTTADSIGKSHKPNKPTSPTRPSRLQLIPLAIGARRSGVNCTTSGGGTIPMERWRSISNKKTTCRPDERRAPKWTMPRLRTRPMPLRFNPSARTALQIDGLDSSGLDGNRLRLADPATVFDPDGADEIDVLAVGPQRRRLKVARPSGQACVRPLDPEQSVFGQMSDQPCGLRSSVSRL